MDIRYACREDAAAIVSLVKEMAQGFGCNTPIRAEYVTEYLNREHSFILVAKCDTNLLAFLSYSARPSLFHAGEAWLIEELIVTEKERGKSIGLALIQTVIDRAKREACVELSIAVSASNQAALKLYKKLGFEDSALLLEQHF